jgi:hypothetical protein
MADLLSVGELQAQIELLQSQLTGLAAVAADKNTYSAAVNQLEAVINPNNSFSEPTTPFAPKYPFNNAKLTESGHLMEFDDTPGAERVSIAHRTGTYFEIGPDGGKVEKIYNDNMQVVMKDNNVYIMGKGTVTVQGDCKVYIQGNAQLQVDGDVNWKVGGNFNLAVDGQITSSANNFNLVGPINHVGDIKSTGNIINQGNIVSNQNIQAGVNVIAMNNVIATNEVIGTVDVLGGSEPVSLVNHVHTDPQGGDTGPPV